MLGINVPDVFAALQIYLGSAYVNDFNLFGRTFRVTAQADGELPARHRRTCSTSACAIRRGDTVPLGSFTTVRDISGPYRVPRYNLYPAAELDGAAAPGYSQGQAIEIMEKLARETLPRGLQLRVDDARVPADPRRQHGDVRLRARRWCSCSSCSRRSSRA